MYNKDVFRLPLELLVSYYRGIPELTLERLISLVSCHIPIYKHETIFTFGKVQSDRGNCKLGCSSHCRAMIFIAQQNEQLGACFVVEKVAFLLLRSGLVTLL